MTTNDRRAERRAAADGSVELDADVLVIGGGPAGTWAAVSAAERGARVVLADKGFCGTSGATAAAGTGVWYVDPNPALREAAMANREKMGGHLQDRRLDEFIQILVPTRGKILPRGRTDDLLSHRAMLLHHLELFRFEWTGL